MSNHLDINIDAFVEMRLNGCVMGGCIAERWIHKLLDWMRYREVVADANHGRLDLWTVTLDLSAHRALEKMPLVEKWGIYGAEVINPVVQLRTDPVAPQRAAEIKERLRELGVA